jgi:hypothetical protein
MTGALNKGGISRRNSVEQIPKMTKSTLVVLVELTSLLPLSMMRKRLKVL